PTAGFQERRRERRALDVVPFEEALEGRHTAAVLLGNERDIDVVRARLLERETHELAATLDSGPVVELINHRGPPLRASPDRSRGSAKRQPDRRTFRSSRCVELSAPRMVAEARGITGSRVVG